jgi:hypothetical protein
MGSSFRNPERNRAMSRAFVNEDGSTLDPRHKYPLPARDDPGYDEAAARVLLQGANEGDSDSAEIATGYRFGEPRLIPWVTRLLEDARTSGNERQEQLAERFLRRAGVEVE